MSNRNQSLVDLLDDTITEPPPFADVDDLIARARRAHRLRWTSGIAGMVIAVLAITSTAALLERPGPRGLDTVAAPPASADPALRRLEETVQAAVRQEAAGVIFKESWTTRWSETPKNAGRPKFWAYGGIRAGDLDGTMVLLIDNEAGKPDFGFSCQHPGPSALPDLDCTTGPGGETIATGSTLDEGIQTDASAQVMRSDGKNIQMLVNNRLGEDGQPTNMAAPLSREQVARIALAIVSNLPDESPEATRRRLESAIGAAVRRAFPTARLQGLRGDGTAVVSGSDPPYTGGAGVYIDGTIQDISISIGRRGSLPLACTPDVECISTGAPGVKWVVAGTVVAPGRPPTVLHNVKVERFAGDDVFITVEGPSPGLTRDQVVEMALDPALTLYV